MNRFGHIDLRVPSLERAKPFYEAWLPALGFHRPFHSPAWKVFAMDGELPQAPYFSLTEDPHHISNANRIAFWAADRAEVDHLASIVRAAGAQHIEGPEFIPVGNYYAVFFEDPWGNRFEIYHRTMP